MKRLTTYCGMGAALTGFGLLAGTGCFGTTLAELDDTAVLGAGFVGDADDRIATVSEQLPVIGMREFQNQGQIPGFEDGTCTGVCDFTSTDVLENLNVKNGGIATLNGTIVTGNIVVEDGGALFLLNGVEVEGNVQSFGGSEISVLDAIVGGSIQIKNTPSIRVERAVVEGDIQLEENAATGTNTLVVSNTMGGNLQVYKNNFGGREAQLFANDVAGNLQLVDNQGGTIVVNDNRVESAAQCIDNGSAITGCGNVVGDLECSYISSGPCAPNGSGSTGGHDCATN